MRAVRLVAVAGVLAFAVSFLAPALGQCQEVKLTALNGATFDIFGTAVALDGDTALIGARGATGQPGRAYVYTNTGGVWGGEVEMGPAGGGTPYDLFGAAVDLSSTRAVATAPWADPAGKDSGAAYVFESSGGIWSQVAKLVASDGAQEDEFGTSAALDGDSLVVGAAQDDDGGLESGSVYAFERQGGVWTEVKKLVASDATSQARFGTAVALDGDRALVAGGGKAYVFDRVGGVWVETAILAPANGAAVTRIAVSGDRALLGAPGTCDEFGCGPGEAFVFELVGGNWNEVASLVSSEGAIEDLFGRALALDGGRAVVAALGPLYKGDEFWNGAAYVFEEASGWGQTMKLTSIEQSFDDGYGAAVALDGEHVLVGANLDSDAGYRHGATYVFTLVDGVENYCFGVGCPCSNDSLTSACVNSTSQGFFDARGALLSACGTTSVATDDLVLTAADLPPNQFGIFFMGGAPTKLPLGDGQRCVDTGAAGLYRYPPKNSGAAGRITLGPGIVAQSQGFPPSGQIVVGRTWFFQTWYRDPTGPCGSGTNLSNAMAIRFAP